jgi:hypothetical protein
MSVAERRACRRTAISPKKWPTPRPHWLGSQLDLDLAIGDQVHGMRELAAARDHSALLQNEVEPVT